MRTEMENLVKSYDEIRNEHEYVLEKVSNGEIYLRNIGEYIELLETPIVFEINDTEGYTYFSGVNHKGTILPAFKTYEDTQSNIISYLDSFEKLTNATLDDLTSEEAEEIGNLSWGVQVLGFYNNIVDLKGSLHDFKYYYARSRFDLAIQLYLLEKIEKKDLDALKEEYIEVKAEYESFIKSALYAD